MVNGVPREVPRPKPEAVMATGISEGLHFTMIHQRLFHRFIPLVSEARMRDFFQPMNSLESLLYIILGLDSEYW